MQEFRIVEPPCSLSGVKPKQTTFTAISDADVQDHCSTCHMTQTKCMLPPVLHPQMRVLE